MSRRERKLKQERRWAAALLCVAVSGQTVCAGDALGNVWMLDLVLD